MRSGLCFIFLSVISLLVFLLASAASSVLDFWDGLIKEEHQLVTGAPDVLFHEFNHVLEEDVCSRIFSDESCDTHGVEEHLSLASVVLHDVSCPPGITDTVEVSSVVILLWIMVISDLSCDVVTFEKEH